MRCAGVSLLAVAGAILGIRFVAPARAEEVPPLVAERTVVKDGAYHVDSMRTQVTFSVFCLGVSQYRGMFSGVSGALQLDSTHPERSRVALRLPVQSLITTSHSVMQTLWGEDWLDARKYPTAEFVSTSVIPEGLSQARVMGRLTLHGVTRPIVLQVHFVGAGESPLDHAYSVGFEAQGTIQRSAFGIRHFTTAVGDDVKLALTGVFVEDTPEIAATP
ncbi:YceI family protein [Acetobacter farinalis]|uniref:YceI family protein n=1 Tax=Acetobacter farinalis TaxID=1260984 RepID=A0ABT3Q9A2_9PROT|nr:YceI family protein [Acetobacter farinalis]MCX2561868.1 YceI family protein [Acetobacter farinalis]NHO30359.1 polyisoprenoid-binding protein [Acetobacter farinalis]